MSELKSSSHLIFLFLPNRNVALEVLTKATQFEFLLNR